jgi:VanZ family protein
MALIFFLSSQKGGSGLGIPAPWDKAAHAVEYGLLGFLLCRGLGWARWHWVLAWIVAVVYGVTDEIHQSLVPGRDASPWDALADAAGGLMGVVLSIRFFSGKVHGRISGRGLGGGFVEP